MTETTETENDTTAQELVVDKALRQAYESLTTTAANNEHNEEVRRFLKGLKAEMDRRNNNLYRWWKVDQFWEHGPTIEVPLIIAILDECQVYLDEENSEAA